MAIIRNFYDELSEDAFKNITYTIFNKMDDEGYVSYLNRYYKELFSINDFKYYDFVLNDKEKFLIKMHNREYLNNVKKLNKIINDYVGVKVYVYYDDGIVRIVKLNKIIL